MLRANPREFGRLARQKLRNGQEERSLAILLARLLPSPSGRGVGGEGKEMKNEERGIKNEELKWLVKLCRYRKVRAPAFRAFSD
jgi:hypothetical protein